MTTVVYRTLHRNRTILTKRLVPLQIFSVQNSFGYRLLKTDRTKKKPGLFKRVTGQLFGRYLLMTNIVGSGVLMIIGDVAAQEIEHRRGMPDEKHNLARIGRMFAVGALQGPLHHYFYNWMDTMLPVVTLQSVFKKIAMDQFIMAPACIFLFFFSAGLLEGKNMKECDLEFRCKFFKVYTVDWFVWPLAQFVNFYWLHPKYRVTYVNFVTMLYNIFLSYVKHEIPGIEVVDSKRANNNNS